MVITTQEKSVYQGLFVSILFANRENIFTISELYV